MSEVRSGEKSCYHTPPGSCTKDVLAAASTITRCPSKRIRLKDTGGYRGERGWWRRRKSQHTTWSWRRSPPWEDTDCPLMLRSVDDRVSVVMLGYLIDAAVRAPFFASGVAEDYPTSSGKVLGSCTSG